MLGNAVQFYAMLCSAVQVRRKIGHRQCGIRKIFYYTILHLFHRQNLPSEITTFSRRLIIIISRLMVDRRMLINPQLRYLPASTYY